MSIKAHTEYKLKEVARRAAIIFAAEGWEWAGVGIPNAEEIEKTIQELLTNKQYGDLPGGTGRLAIYEDELCGDGGVMIALELGGLSGEEIGTL
ncbi:hypothetical protein LCGC14_2065490 [marine sediment metagenome]|uniref:Uncharacterized protein n=1 Tax=marine sediment metagenome TaxID=412755 RepID=A0A0F9F7C0_9ZZZZ